jgi:hypothetical protein
MIARVLFKKISYLGLFQEPCSRKTYTTLAWAKWEGTVGNPNVRWEKISQATD